MYRQVSCCKFSKLPSQKTNLVLFQKHMQETSPEDEAKRTNHAIANRKQLHVLYFPQSIKRIHQTHSSKAYHKISKSNKHPAQVYTIYRIHAYLVEIDKARVY